MTPSVAVTLALVIGALLLLLPRLLSRTRDSLQIFRSLRSTRKARYVDWALIAAYHRRFAERPGIEPIDDRTWRDLDLDEVFLSLDHTASEPGRQALYHRLRSPQFDAESLARMDRVVRSMAADEATANRVRAILSRLSDPRAASLENLLFGDLPSRPRFWWLFPLLTAGAVTCMASVAFWPRMGLIWLAICVVNLGVQLVYKPRVKRFIPALHELPAFLRVARELGELPLGDLADEARVLREGATRLGALRSATWWLMFEPGQTSELAASMYEYVNILFLLDINAFVFSTGTLRASRDTTRGMFEALATIDVAQSVAAWRETLPHWSTPAFMPAAKALRVESLIHPLVVDAVANSLDIDGASVLITGSNMSGKTTFVRALGVSAVLAQTLATACATVWRAPMLRVRTSITRSDSVMDGRSYYLAEVEAVLSLIRAKEGGEQHLFLLDEIFRGTNTTERVAAAFAVLAYLNRGLDMAVVATHDLELLDLLRDAYALHHFRETIADDGLTFDYRMRNGPSTTRNAIALLKLMQYPEEVVAAALGQVAARRADAP